MNNLRLAWKNLISQPLSMTLTLTLFALGVGLTALLLLLNKQLSDTFEKNLAGIDVVMGAKGSPMQLILCNMYHVDVPTGNIPLTSAKPFLNPKHPLIAQAIPLSLGDSYKGFRIVGTLPEFVGLYKGTIETGQLWQKPLEVTIGKAVADRAGLSVGVTFNSNHGLTTDGEAHDHAAFKVVGIFAPTGTVLDQLIVTSCESIWEVHEHAEAEQAEEDDDHKDHDHADHNHDHDHDHDTPSVTDPRTALLQADSSHDITSLLVKFKVRNVQSLNFQRNINENTGMQAATPALEINRLFEQMGVGEKALRSLAFVIIGVSGLSIFIALFNSLKERRYELALMRVMGAGRRRLWILIILEGLLLSGIGFIIGIALSHTAMEVLAAYMSDAYRYSLTGRLWLREEWWLLIGALLIGFAAAVLPALSAYRTDISKTLTRR
jgi:putative ABC transport system permease protein